MHSIDRLFKLIDVNLQLCKTKVTAGLFEVVLDNMVLGELALEKAVDIFRQIFRVLLEEHREPVFDALRVTYGVDRQQERDDQASRLVDRLHCALHGYEGVVFLPGGRLSDRSFDAVLLSASFRVLDLLEVALGVDVSAIDDQRLAILEALGDVEVTPVSDSTTLAFESGDDLLSGG